MQGLRDKTDQVLTEEKDRMNFLERRLQDFTSQPRPASYDRVEETRHYGSRINPPPVQLYPPQYQPATTYHTDYNSLVSSPVGVPGYCTHHCDITSCCQCCCPHTSCVVTTSAPITTRVKEIIKTKTSSENVKPKSSSNLEQKL